jgi:hypothetical protein
VALSLIPEEPVLGIAQGSENTGKRFNGPSDSLSDIFYDSLLF